MDYSDGVEPLLTIKQLAAALRQKYWQVQRASKRGDLPYYQPFNSRKLFRLSEVLEAMKKSRSEGARNEH